MLLTRQQILGVVLNRTPRARNGGDSAIAIVIKTFIRHESAGKIGGKPIRTKTRPGQASMNCVVRRRRCRERDKIAPESTRNPFWISALRVKCGFLAPRQKGRSQRAPPRPCRGRTPNIPHGKKICCSIALAFALGSRSINVTRKAISLQSSHDTYQTSRGSLVRRFDRRAMVG